MSDYIGKRIVPKHCGEWDKDTAYEMLCIVLHTESGESYISRCEVPSGVEITDGKYWAVCSRFSQQVKDMEIHLQETETRMAEDLRTTKGTMSGELEQAKQAMSQELDETEQFLTGKVDAADEALREGREELEETAEMLAKRMDHLTGSVTEDSELLDIRVDEQGEIHDTAGDAVRSITDGLIPKIKPQEVNIAVESGSENQARIETEGHVVRANFSYAGTSYIGLFASFFGSFDEIRNKRYRVVIRSDDNIPDLEVLITNSKSAWGSHEGTVGYVSLNRCAFGPQGQQVLIQDIDFSESRWEEFLEKYTRERNLYFCLRVQNTQFLIPSATVYFYAYEQTSFQDFFWKYVSGNDRLMLLEQEVADSRNDGTEYPSLGDVIRRHGEAAREVEEARHDSRGITFKSLPERLNNMDGFMRPRLPIDRQVAPRDNKNGILKSEDSFMGGEIINGNAVFRFCYSDYLLYESPHWGSLNFSFEVSYEHMLLLQHMDNLYLDIRLECSDDKTLHAGDSIPITYYINGYEAWGTVINKMLTKTAIIGQRNLIQLEEEQVRNVLAEEKPLFIVFVGSFLNSDIFMEMNRIRITASIIDRSQIEGLYAYTGYADTAELALFSQQANTSNYALESDFAKNASFAYSADTALLADNFFLNSPDEILNVAGKRYSPGMDTGTIPIKSPYTMNGAFQTAADGREIVRETGGFSDVLYFHIPLSQDVSQPQNQGYIKQLTGLITFDEMLEKFEEGYQYGYICALEDWERYPEASKSGSHPQNLLISGYPDGATMIQYVNNQTPAVRKVSDTLTLSVWKYQITKEQLMAIREAQSAEIFRMGWFGIWNTREYREESTAVWEAVWYWSDYAFTDDSYSEEDMLTFFLNKYAYWASLVNHVALKQRFMAVETAIEGLNSTSEDLLKANEEMAEGMESLNEEMERVREEVGLENGLHITCWGDSLTAGGGWTTTLAALSGAIVHNGGTGGENARCIAARQGADVMTINNITIPAECEPVTIAVRAEDTGITTEWGYKVTPLLQGGSHVNPVDIGGVLGTLRWTGANYADQTGIWTFTRLEAGEEVAITRPTAIRTAFDRERNGKSEIMVIFIGQNGGYTDIDDLIRTHRLMIDHFKGKEYVILGLSSGTAAQRADYEAAMTEAFGRRFVSLRAYLAHPIYDTDGKTIISCYGLDDAGLDPTDADIERIKNGQVPQTLLSDSVHYTAETKTVIGTMLYKKMVELGILE